MIIEPLREFIMFVISHVIVIILPLIFDYFMILSLFILTFIMQAFISSAVVASTLPVQPLSQLFGQILPLKVLELPLASSFPFLIL